MNLARSEALVGQLEKLPERMPLYFGDLETMIATLMEETYQLSLTDTDNDRKMRLVALECRARLMLDRFRRQNVN